MIFFPTTIMIAGILFVGIILTRNPFKSNKHKGFPEYKFNPIPPKLEYNRITPIQCKSCGAQVKHEKCDYCGNEYPDTNPINKSNILFKRSEEVNKLLLKSLNEIGSSSYIIQDESDEILIKKP